MADELKNPIAIAANREIAQNSNVTVLLSSIRPEWQARNLVQRVVKLLPVDPSSACQRLFNAAIHDLKKKILVAGIDIAKEAATANRLPQINRAEDVDEYNVSKTIDLAYYMGLLTRPEWRRLTRVYDIRRDLEHEDDEYEATLEDCFYIFKTSIESVLAKDPVEVLRLLDIKQIVEQSSVVTLDQTVKDEYRVAPVVRQVEIYKFLVSTALDPRQPDIVRQNCYIALGTLNPLTKDQVKIEASQIYSDFRSHARHGELLRDFRESGGLEYCPDDILPDVVEWLALCYIGEQSFGQYSSSRRVFYSNVGAPLAKELLVDSKDRVGPVLKQIIGSSKDIKAVCKWPHCARRAQDLLDKCT